MFALASVLSGILALAFVIFAISAFIGVPFLPTHRRQAHKMIALAQLKPGMQVIDLGSGAGRLLFAAAATGASVVGYELNPFLVWWTRLMIRCKGLQGRVTVHMRSLYSADVRGADVVFAFLFPEPMKKLSVKLFAELKPGAKIISYVFAITDKKPDVVEEGIFVYEVKSTH